ncbi:hypothetical protein GT028_27095 [Streptomyces sp. SID2999]|uniref:hypothetical protein n=1 Tax=Streptomyces sp. SID2999 TaxID=2690258 RepID=UPI00137170B5|nr:hypothetical protein [Streptomyces sp. SID2999]MYZ10998.1 hypothetical protein [Streptomyces sp. SID2999]
MFGYWLAAVRRLAVAALVVMLVIGGAAAALLVADSSGWAEALLQGVAIGAGWGAVFVCVIATSSTVQAGRAARRYGLVLDQRAAVVPSVQVVRVPIRGGTTPYQVTETVLHALRGVPAPRVGEVVEFTHGKLAVQYDGPGDIDVALRVAVMTDGDTATVEMTAAPVSTRKKLDGGASWSILAAVEPVVREALLEEAGV